MLGRPPQPCVRLAYSGSWQTLSTRLSRRRRPRRRKGGKAAVLTDPHRASRPALRRRVTSEDSVTEMKAMRATFRWAALPKTRMICVQSCPRVSRQDTAVVSRVQASWRPSGRFSEGWRQTLPAMLSAWWLSPGSQPAWISPRVCALSSDWPPTGWTVASPRMRGPDWFETSTPAEGDE